MTNKGASQVLRDVVVQGQLALTRPRSGSDAKAQLHAPSLVPTRIGRQMETVSADMPGSASQAAAEIGEQARRQGYEEGFAKGRAEGRAQGSEEAQRLAGEAAEQAARELEAHAQRTTQVLRQEAQAAYQARIQVLDGLIAALPPQVEARLAAAEDDMLALCFEVVCRVLGESAARPEMLRAQLNRAMDSLRHRQLVAVHLHPDDLAALERDHGLGASRPGGKEVQWVADAGVALGGCILQSPEGGLDARLETQLHALRDLLQQTRAAARASLSAAAVSES